MKFIGIWFNMDQEIKRDVVEADNANQASEKLHSLYVGRREPGPALAVVPHEGSSKHGGDTNGYYQTTWRS